LGEDLYRLLKPKFDLPRTQYPGRVSEVRLGNTLPEGTRARTIVLGGAADFPFFGNQDKASIRPHIAMQVQVPPQNIPLAVSTALADLLNDPVKWARFCVKECGVEAVQVKFSLNDGAMGQEVLKGVRELSQQLVDELDVPLIFSGPDNREAEPQVLETVAATTKGERVLLASARLDNDYTRIAQAAISNQHVVLASTDCDPPSQKMLNDRLLDLGLSRDQLVIDPTTAALGYGLEYSLSITEQIRLNALKGDSSLQMPIVAFPVNSWSAREANLEDREHDGHTSRGIMWELASAVAMFLAGAELLVMIHPESVRRFNILLSEADSFEPPNVGEQG